MIYILYIQLYKPWNYFLSGSISTLFHDQDHKLGFVWTSWWFPIQWIHSHHLQANKEETIELNPIL